MKKRLFAIMLALAMLLAAVPALAEEGDGREAPESTKKICLNCKAKDKVNEEGLCEKCVSNLKQDNTQQKMITSLKTLNEDNTEGGANGGGTGDNNGDNTGGDPGNNAGNTDNNGGNTSGEAGDNNGESNNPDSTDSSGSTGGDTGTDGGQNPPTSGGGEGGEQETCAHEWGIPIDAEESDREHYCHMHKKTCSKCPAEKWEKHVWDRENQKMVEESTCTKEGRDRLPCTLCSHVTFVSRALKPHTKDNGKVIKPATCTEKGKIKYTCTECKSELPEEEIPALGHDYDDPTWNWCGVSSATATFRCRRNCGEENAIVTCQARLTRSSINNCGYYTYTATVQFNGKTYTDMRTDYSCRPDWYYDPCYYNNPCGHWGCGNVCTRYSNCVPCQNYRTTFRVGGYNCLATPKTGDVSVIGMALISLAGAGAAIMGKKRK